MIMQLGCFTEGPTVGQRATNSGQEEQTKGATITNGGQEELH